MKINVVCSPYGNTGYARHSREFARALSKITDVSIECDMPQNWESMVDSEIRELINKEKTADVNLMITLPYAWGNKSGEKTPLVGFLVFEGSKLHESWFFHSIRPYINRIFVPSEHTKQACINTEIDKYHKVDIIPEGVDRTIFNENVEQIQKNEFTFLFSGGWSKGKDDRKGLDIALEAFTEEFKDENVRFVCKINSVYAPIDYKKAIKDLNLKGEATKKIVINSDIVTDQVLASIYKSADVLVAPSKAEGFGLHILEAMSCGTPAITTNYGGQTDFVNKENGWLIDVEKMFKPENNEVWYEECEWAEPSIKSLRKAMREAYENKKLLNQKSIKSIETAKNFTWEKAAQKAIKILKDLK